MRHNTSIHGLNRHQVVDLCRELGQPDYRAGQIWRWLYRQYAGDWAAMTNLPKPLVTALAERFSLNSAIPLSNDQDGRRTADTVKLLIALQDGECVEEVVIPARGRKTVCVSSQVGCRWACAFCASGQAGFKRDLEAGEMVGQVIAAARIEGQCPTHVVFMGIGEPFDNYDAVFSAIRILNDPEGLKIGARRITLSTAGVIPGILRLAEEGLQVELSVSLHAPDNALRSQLMPVNRKYPLPELMQACADYVRKTGRIITFEYTLIRGVNDSEEQALALGRMLQALSCRVNLIPLSGVAEYGGQPAPAETTARFMRILERAKINVTERASRGGHIDAACGQLRRSRMESAREPAQEHKPEKRVD